MTLKKGFWPAWDSTLVADMVQCLRSNRLAFFQILSVLNIHGRPVAGFRRIQNNWPHVHVLFILEVFNYVWIPKSPPIWERATSHHVVTSLVDFGI